MARQHRRQRGAIDTLPNGSLRVRVSAGYDPVTKRRHYLTEIIPPGPKATDLAEKARTRLLGQLDERRHPRTSATLNQLLDEHLEMLEAEETTRRTYQIYVDKHIRPLLGSTKVGALDADILDSFYAELRRCRDHCRGRRFIEHYARGDHECDERCRPHECRPLAAWTIRKLHFILSGAYKRAVRWKWVSVNPVGQAEPPSAPAPDPQPPSAQEGARILNEAWKDADFGPLVWLAMTTGVRRGELCALRWSHFNPERGVLTVRRSIAQDGAETWEKDTKTHQRRHVALDAETVSILAEYRERCDKRAAAIGLMVAPNSFIFSATPNGDVGLKPASITQRYDRLAARVGIETTLHKLRHYSATELITAGVDIRTVAGRLGHAGGGTTTLKVYAAWVSEADQRASSTLLSRMPKRPAPPPDPSERAKTDPRSPYEVIASGLRQQILDGVLTPGDPLPPIVQIARKHAVAVGTAHRAISLLSTWGLINVTRGRRAIVQPVLIANNGTSDDTANESSSNVDAGRELLDLELIHQGSVVGRFSAEADPKRAADLRQLLVDAVKRNGGDATRLGEYEMNVRYAGERGLVTTFAAASVVAR